MEKVNPLAYSVRDIFFQWGIGQALSTDQSLRQGVGDLPSPVHKVLSWWPQLVRLTGITGSGITKRIEI